MSGKEYRATIEALGLTQVAAGEFLGVTERTSRRWVRGDDVIPRSVAVLLRLMCARKITAKAAAEAAGFPPPPPDRRRKVAA
jgi:transcriptional regulator with XRE-family HTH domain